MGHEKMMFIILEFNCKCNFNHIRASAIKCFARISIVITQNDMHPTRNLQKIFQSLLVISKHYIAENIKIIIGFKLKQIMKNNPIHFFYVIKTTRAIYKGTIMSEMKVRSYINHFLPLFSAFNLLYFHEATLNIKPLRVFPYHFPGARTNSTYE